MIIIGAGITGLSTALAYSKVYDLKEKPVLILERNSTPGGCVSTFARKGYRFDTTQIIPDVSNILEFFDLDIPLKRFENYYARLFLANTQTKTSKVIPIPSTREDFEKSLIEKYPEDKENISTFFDYCQAMHDELVYLKTEPKWYQLIKILVKCRKIISKSNYTYEEFLDGFKFNNPEVVQVLDTFSSFSGLSKDRCAALLTACAMITTLKGSYRPEKGFIQFPITLRKAFEERGGEVRMNTEVKEIIVRIIRQKV